MSCEHCNELVYIKAPEIKETNKKMTGAERREYALLTGGERYLPAPARYCRWCGALCGERKRKSEGTWMALTVEHEGKKETRYVCADKKRASRMKKHR